jgi:hypothetical protein
MKALRIVPGPRIVLLILLVKFLVRDDDKPSVSIRNGLVAITGRK